MCGRSHRRPRHRIGVPRGMLFYITLGILERGPMSGSEIRDEIDYFTDWRPSPGSIYPLLSKLREQGLIEQVEDGDPMLKRFSLTEKGESEVHEAQDHMESFKSRYRTIRKIYWRLFQQMSMNLYESNSQLLEAVEQIQQVVREKPEAATKLQEILENATTQINELCEALEDKL